MALNNTTHPITLNASNGITDYVLGTTLAIINVTIIFLNGIAILVITRFRNKSAIDILVLGLSFTDLIKGLIPVPMSVIVYLTPWHLTEHTMKCNFFGWIAFSTNSNSMLILTLMSFERYLAIARPFSYKSLVTPKRVKIALTIALIFTMLHSSFPLIGLGRMRPFYDGAYCHFDYSRTYSAGTRAYSIFVLCYGFFLIAVVMVSYSIVFYKIRDLIGRQSRMSRKVSVTSFTTDNKCRDRSSSIADKRIVKVGAVNLKMERMFSYLTVALIVLFWFSWLPFLSVVLISQLGISTPHKKVDLFAIRVAVVNSMLNPIACALLCKPYRRGALFYIKKLLSYTGLPEPSSDVFDPWSPRRRSSTARGMFPKSKSSYSPSRTHGYSTEASFSHTDSGVGGQSENYYAEFPVRGSSDISNAVHGRYSLQPSPIDSVRAHPLFTVQESSSNYEVQENSKPSDNDATCVDSDSSTDNSDDSGIDKELQTKQLLLPLETDHAAPDQSCDCDSQRTSGVLFTRAKGRCSKADPKRKHRSIQFLSRRKSCHQDRDYIHQNKPRRWLSFSHHLKEDTNYNRRSKSNELARKSCTGCNKSIGDSRLGDTPVFEMNRQEDSNCNQDEFGTERNHIIKGVTTSEQSRSSRRARSSSHCNPLISHHNRPYSKRYSMPDMQTGLDIINDLTKELVDLSRPATLDIPNQ